MSKIGFFDSGHGGLSLLQACGELLPNHEYYYIADMAHHPYGNKTNEQVIERSFNLTRELTSKGCQTIVVACNTATALAIDRLRLEFKDIRFVGIEPYLNIISKKEFHDDERLGVIVTPRTFESSRFIDLKKRVDPDNRLEVVPLPGLASFVEDSLMNLAGVNRGDLETILSEIKNKKWSHLVLGCTHYPLIKEWIEDILNVQCIDPSLEVANQLKRIVLDSAAEKSREVFSTFFYQTSQNNIWSQKKSEDFFASLIYNKQN